MRSHRNDAVSSRTPCALLAPPGFGTRICATLAEAPVFRSSPLLSHCPELSLHDGQKLARQASLSNSIPSSA